MNSGYIFPGHYLVDDEKTLNSEIQIYLGKDTVVSNNVVRLDQYPGVFLYPNINNEEDIYNNFFHEVVFVLSLSLLRKRGWHISLKENYGSISSLTWDFKTFPEYLMSHYNYPDKFGELVMHYPVPLEYVECIVVSHNVETVRSIVNGRFVVYTLEEFKRLSKTKYVKHLYTNGDYDSGEPNFCYDNMGGDDYVILPPNNIKNTLLNCGYNVRHVDNLMNENTYDELVTIIQNTWTSNLLSRKYPKLYSHPPY